MKFQFRLETALRLVVVKERKMKAEIAKVYRRVERVKARITSLQDNIRTLLTRTIGSSIGTEWLSYQSGKIESDGRERDQLEKDLVDLSGLLDQRKDQLSRILLKRKAYENKRETELKEFRMVRDRKVQRTLDDNYRLLRRAHERTGRSE